MRIARADLDDTRAGNALRFGGCQRIAANRRACLQGYVGDYPVGIVFVEPDPFDLTHLDTVELDIPAHAEAANRALEDDPVSVIFIAETRSAQPYDKHHAGNQQQCRDGAYQRVIGLPFHQMLSCCSAAARPRGPRK